MQFLSLEKLGGDFRSLLYSVRGGRPTSAFSLAPGAKIHVAAELKSKVLFVTADSLQAKDVAKNSTGISEGKRRFICRPATTFCFTKRSATALCTQSAALRLQKY